MSPMSICELFRKYPEAPYEIAHRQKASCLSASGHFLGVPGAMPPEFTMPVSSVFGVKTITHIVQCNNLESGVVARAGRARPLKKMPEDHLFQKHLQRHQHN